MIMMNDILQQDVSVLINLRDKVYNFIKINKDPLHQVLRYWMYEYIVPLQIEGVTKYIILNYDTILPDTSYEFIHKHSHDNTNQDVNIQFSFDHRDGIYIMRQCWDGREQSSQSFSLTRFDDRREIVYGGKIYRSVADSGTVYRHLMTQYEDVKTYSLQDVQAGLISEQEQLAFEILHLFHDIPEMGTMEMCNNQTKMQGKTEIQSQSEYERGLKIIDVMSELDQLEKDILKTIYTEDTKKSLFKVWEHLRWITYDSMLIYAHRRHHHNRKKVVGEMSFSFLHELVDTYYFLSGKAIVPIGLESIKKHLRIHRAWIDFMIDQTEKEYLPSVHPQRKDEFQDKKTIRQNIKEKL